MNRRNNELPLLGIETFGIKLREFLKEPRCLPFHFLPYGKDFFVRQTALTSPGRQVGDTRKRSDF